MFPVCFHELIFHPAAASAFTIWCSWAVSVKVNVSVSDIPLLLPLEVLIPDVKLAAISALFVGPSPMKALAPVDTSMLAIMVRLTDFVHFREYMN